MKTPIIRYSKDQLRAIAILSIKPLTKEELFSHFPHLSHKEKVALLRNPRELGKITLNCDRKYEVNKLESNGLTVTHICPQPFSPPPKFEFLYESGKSLKEKH